MRIFQFVMKIDNLHGGTGERQVVSGSYISNEVRLGL